MRADTIGLDDNNSYKNNNTKYIITAVQTKVLVDYAK